MIAAFCSPATNALKLISSTFCDPPAFSTASYNFLQGYKQGVIDWNMAFEFVDLEK